MQESKKKKLNRILNVYIGVGVLMWILAAVLILTPILPQLIYRLFPQAQANEIKSLTTNLDDDEQTFADIRDKYLNGGVIENELPPFDPTLPKSNRLIISSIGVDSEIQTGEDWELALEKGPWIVSNLGTPETVGIPSIIASHRWGIITWTSQERAKKSFYNLPDLHNTDTIEIIWNQRRYEYKVYNEEENIEISDYDADLILYTCKLFWESPIRILRYAHRTN